MERHERYDPEDIESLLSERAFDELLPDERAFVLRHLSDRDEYERMRALLHYVRPDERERGTIEPEPRVKQHVLAAFRAQQQPQWRIWLNTIAAWFAPGEAAAIPLWRDRLWRPALAFGSLALLVVAGVVAVRQFSGVNESAAVAEVKQVEHDADQPPQAKEEKTAPFTVPEGTSGNTESLPPLASTREHSNEMVTADEPTGAMTGSAAAEVAEPAVFDAVKFVPMEEDLAVSNDGMTVQPTAPATDSFSHTVTQDELARNMSVTNATGKVALDVSSQTPRRKLRAADAASTSRSMAEDPGILGLVSAGW